MVINLPVGMLVTDVNTRLNTTMLINNFMISNMLLYIQTKDDIFYFGHSSIWSIPAMIEATTCLGKYVGDNY